MPEQRKASPLKPSPWPSPGGRGKLKLGNGEVGERTVADRLAYLSHQAQVVRHVVQGIEVQPEDFVGNEQMAQVRPGGVLTGIAVTVCIKGTFIGTILRVLDHHTSCRGKHNAIARVTRGKDTVEHVDPSAHALEQVVWFTNPHEIARLMRRQLGCSMRGEVIHDVPWFTNAQATYSIAIEATIEQGLHTAIAQCLIGAALDNAKEPPRTVLPCLLTPPGPAAGHLHGQAGGIIGRRVWRALVQNHYDI